MVRFVKTDEGTLIAPEHIVQMWIPSDPEGKPHKEAKVLVKLVTGSVFTLPSETIKDALGYVGAVV